MPASKYEIYVNLSPSFEDLSSENSGTLLRQAITSVEIIPPITRTVELALSPSGRTIARLQQVCLTPDENHKTVTMAPS